MSNTIANKFAAQVNRAVLEQSGSWKVSIKDVVAIAKQFGEFDWIDSGEGIEFADGSIAKRDYVAARNEIRWIVEA